jgi:hypothetical protein
MNDAGRMAQRLASSYHEDDRRRADESRRPQLPIPSSSASTVEPTTRFIGSAILRLMSGRS